MAETYSTKPMIERTADQEAAIRGAWDQIKNDPVAVNNALRENNISASDLAHIAGLNQDTLNSYLGSAGTYGGLGGMPPGWDQYSQSASAPRSGGQAGSPFTTGGGGGGGYASGGSVSMSGQNPYLPQLGGIMAQQMTDNFARRIAPAIGSQAMAAGGYGGSRQGVLEANAINDLNQQIGSGLANLYGQGYGQSLNYDLGLKNNDLGWGTLNGNLGLGYANLDRNIANDNNNWQLQGANFGLGVYDRLQQGNQAGINAGTNIHNTPMNYWSQFGNQYNSIGQGYGSTTGSASQQGNPIMGALGGAQLGSRLGQMWGGSPNAAGGANSQGWGTGSGYGNQDLGSYF